MSVVQSTNDENTLEIGTRSSEEHVCVLCRVTIDPASNPGRVLTRACYEAYGLDPEQVQATKYALRQFSHSIVPRTSR